MYQPISRRQMLGAAAGIAAAAVSSAPAFAPAGVLWKLWARYVTGGAPYRPSFAAMFLDPMFVQVEVVAADLPLNAYPGYNPLVLSPSPPPASSALREGGFGNA